MHTPYHPILACPRLTHTHLSGSEFGADSWEYFSMMIDRWINGPKG